MKRAIVPLLLVLAWVTSASADIIHMRDGTAREGRIVTQTDDVIVLEVASGSTKANITINRADIDRIEEKQTASQALDAELKKRLAAIDRTNADAVIGVAKWCASNKLFTEAEALLKDLGAQGAAEFSKAGVALGNIEYDRQRFPQAKKAVAAVLEKDPKNIDARALMDRIVADEKRIIEKSLTDGIDLASKGRFDAALDKLENFHDHAAPDHAKEVLARTTFPGDMKFEDFVADVRLRLACPACKGGTKVCPTCKGKVNEDTGPCKTCAGIGTVICNKCDGTGVKMSDVPDWEASAVARAFEQRAVAETAEFRKAAKELEAGVPKDKLMALAGKAELSGSRASRWLTELETLTAKRSAGTTASVATDRETLDKEFRALCAKLGDTLGKQGTDSWATIDSGLAGMLAQDKPIRAVRDDLVRALHFYSKTRKREKDPYEQPVAVQVDADTPLLAKVEKIIDHNVKVLKGFDLALKDLGTNQLAQALQIFVEIVNNSSKLDLAWLSAKTAAKINGTLPEVMAACRFEMGKESGKFGDTTDYERAAFMKKLLTEADAKSAEAHNSYNAMWNYAGAGNRNSTPTGLVHKTRDLANYAVKWYRASLLVPYPLSADKRTAVNDAIHEMDSIINHCNTWYLGGVTTGGTGINTGP